MKDKVGRNENKSFLLQVKSKVAIDHNECDVGKPSTLAVDVGGCLILLNHQGTATTNVRTK